MSISLLRKNNSDAITPYTDAVAWHTVLGDGILANAYQGCKCTVSNGVVTISSGLILYGGYLAEIGKGTSVSIDISSLADPCYVILSLTLAEPETEEDDEGNETMTDNSSVTIYATDDKPSTYTGTEMLFAVSNGRYGTFEIVLFQIDGGTTVTQVIDTLEPGVAKNANNLLSTGYLVNGDGDKVALADIFTSDLSGVRYAVRAETCAEAQGFVGGQANVVDEDLYMTNRGVYLVTMAQMDISSITATISSSSSAKAASLDSDTASALKSANAIVMATVTCGGVESPVNGLAGNIEGQNNGEDAAYCAIDNSGLSNSSTLGLEVDLGNKSVYYKSLSGSVTYSSVAAMTLRIYMAGV